MTYGPSVLWEEGVSDSGDREKSRGRKRDRNREKREGGATGIEGKTERGVREKKRNMSSSHTYIQTRHIL